MTDSIDEKLEETDDRTICIPRLITREALMKLLNIDSSMQMNRLCHKYGLSFYRVGDQIMFDPEDVHAWLEARKNLKATNKGRPLGRGVHIGRQKKKLESA